MSIGLHISTGPSSSEMESSPARKGKDAKEPMHACVCQDDDMLVRMRTCYDKDRDMLRYELRHVTVCIPPWYGAEHKMLAWMMTCKGTDDDRQRIEEM